VFVQQPTDEAGTRGRVSEGGWLKKNKPKKTLHPATQEEKPRKEKPENPETRTHSPHPRCSVTKAMPNTNTHTQRPLI